MNFKFLGTIQAPRSQGVAGSGRSRNWRGRWGLHPSTLLNGKNSVLSPEGDGGLCGHGLGPVNSFPWFIHPPNEGLDKSFFKGLSSSKTIVGG